MRGQVVIPKEIREKAEIYPGDPIKFSISKKRIIIEKIELISDGNFIKFLKRGKKFDKDFIANLRGEWE